MWACRYATPGGFRESALAAGLRGDDLANADKQKQARHRMYTPGGPMARELAKNPTVLIVNDTLFAHGGVLKRHGTSLDVNACLACNPYCLELAWLKLCDCIAVQYGLEKMNQEVSSWMRGLHNADGSRPTPPFFATGSVIFLWSSVVVVCSSLGISTLVAACWVSCLHLAKFAFAMRS